MLDDLLGIVAPHHCSGCGEVGSILCASCKFDITSQVLELCVCCTRRFAGKTGVCLKCRPPYQRAWSVGLHAGVLDRLIDSYKFGYARAAAEPLAELLDAALPVLPSGSIIVPVPTIARHIRERGFDPVGQLAARLASSRSLALDNGLLERRTQTIQQKVSAKQRQDQAKAAYQVCRQVNSDQPIILIDDVMTTGATLWYAAKVLRQAGAEQVWIAVIARHVPQ